MKLLERFGAGVDSLIGVFSPIKAYRNALIRQEMQRGYSAVRNTPSTIHYWGAVGDPNSDIRADRAKVSQRVRQLVRDMPWLDEALEHSVDYKVGEGFSMKPAVRREDGSLDTELNSKIKDAFLRWCEKCEVNGRDSFGDIQRLLVRQMVEVGEAVMYHDYRGRKYRLQVFEPDRIDSTQCSDTIDQGIEFDPDTNKFLNFHMKSLYSTAEKAQEEFIIPAERITFLYRAKRPWQRRGISPLVQCIFLAADLDEYMHNELAAQQMAARWLAFITSPNEDAMPNDGKIRTQELDNLTVEHLPEGKTVQLAPGAARPTTGMEAFKNIFLKLLATKTKVPFHLLSNDYSGLNYNTLREMRINFVHTEKPEWAYLTSHLLNDVYRRWMDFAVLSGELRLPGYELDPRHYQQCFWMPPGIESVDLLRDVKGVIAASEAGMYDPQDWIMSQGEDPEEVIDGLAEFRERLKARGIAQEDQPTKIDDNENGDTALEE